MALQQVRSEVNSQLDGDTLANLRRTVQQTKEPLETMKEQMLQQLGYFVSEADDGFQTATTSLVGESSVVYPSSLAVVLASCGVAILGILALLAYSLCHRGGEEPDPCCVCTCSASAMCTTYIFAGIMFFIGGILLLVTMVGGGVCLAMVDFDEQSGQTLLQSLGVPASDNVNMALRMADRCMSLKSEGNTTRNVADILEFPATSPSYPGKMSTARELLADLVASKIDETFLVLEEAMASQPLRLADNPILAQIRGYLGSVNFKAMYWPNPAEIQAHSTYKAMPPPYYVVSVLCQDLQLPDQLPSVLANAYVPGLNSMVVDGISTGSGPRMPGIFPAQDVTWNCPIRLEGDCADSNLPLRESCEASKAFLLERKLPLITLPIFRCRYLQLPGAPPGTKCNIEDMYKENGTWINSCVHPNRTVTFFEQDCDISEFEENIQSFEMWLYKIFQYLDDTVVELLNQVGIVLNYCQYGVLYLGSYYNTGPYINFPHFGNSNLRKLPGSH